MTRSPLILFVALLAAQAWAEYPAPEIVPQREIPKELSAPTEKPPLWLRWMIKPILRGMFIRLPIMDTDPNRGVTGGFMPILVLKSPGSERIEHIHAPSLTYNQNFGTIPTYRYYYYPQEDATLIMRGSISKYEREVLGHYEDQSLLGSEFDVLLKVQYNVDAGQRFFGIGPDTPRSAEANYKEDFIQYRLSVGHPLLPRSRWRLHASNHLIAETISNGPLKGLPGFEATYPGVAPHTRQQANQTRLTLDYDSRDHALTTTRGSFLQAFAEYSVRGLASSYDFSRYGLDARHFLAWAQNPKKVLAAQFRYEQMQGNAPFWLMPRLGGKYSLRSYGEGRYIDRGAVSANLEQRFTLHSVKMGGVTTEFELAPFAGLGTVFDSPERLARRYLRSVLGLAIRAVARPQVVGSVDFGLGHEGLAVFMDINYSF
jgi:hypothetical protein